MTIKDILINEYPLTKKIECPLECYEVVKRRYVIFLDEIINRNNMELLLDIFDKATKTSCSEKKTLIIVGYTDERFEKEDLVFFNCVDTFVVYYLINEKSNEIFFNDQRNCFFCVGWKKVIKKFNEILK